MAARKNRGGGRRKEPEVVDVDAIEEVDEGGMGIDEGIILCTTLFLGVAVWLIFSALETYPKLTGG